MFYGMNPSKAVKSIIARRKMVNIATIVPDDSFRLTKNENLLKEAAIDGARKIFQLFNKETNTSNILEYT